MLSSQFFRQANVWLAAAALLIAGGSYWLANRYLMQQAQATRAQLTQAWATRDVIVASAELPAGSRVVATSLARRAVPERYLASDALVPATAGAAVGLRLLRPLRAGEVLSRSALELPGETTLANLVEPGERALTIPVDESNAAAGLLAPGDYVDLLLVLHDAGNAGSADEPRVQPLLQAVQVLATGRVTRAHAGEAAPGADAGYATITLRLHPEEAQRVLLAQKLGELSVAVRPAGETGPVALAPMGRAALFQATAAHAAARAARPAPVEFIIGGVGAAPVAAARTRGGARS
jgi:pilus assembly protein CpaB